MPRLSNGLEQVFTNLGIVGSGYKLYFFQTGTTTPKTTYSDEGLTIANSNPIILDAAGRAQTGIWGSDPSLYRMALGTPDSTISTVLLNPVVDVDPVDMVSINNIAGLTPIPTAFWGTTAGTSTHYTLDPALVNITSYSNEQSFFIDFHTTCGAGPDIDINNLGTLNLKKKTGQGTKIALLAGDVNGRHTCNNDGADIVILDPISSPIYTGKPPTLTIATGVVVVTNSASNYLLATEGDASTDDLETINGLADGEIAWFQIADATKNVVIKQTGNIFIQSGVDITLDLTTDIVGFKYNATLAKAVLLTSSTSASGMVLLDTKTASNSATLEFTTFINSIYSKYIFDLHGIYPGTNQTRLQMQVSEDGGTNWKSGASDYSTTTNMFSISGVTESGNGTNTFLSISDYNIGGGYGINNNAAGALNGSFALFDPSSSGNVKKINGSNTYDLGGISYINLYSGSYVATTNPINAVKFFMSSGNITAGKIKMFGVL